ncbi:hypothetical protein E2320_001573, partial [Naja naja]
VFYVWLKAIYTLGHSVSLIALIAGSIILCVFRKLHCTRNYIHLNLFLSFILKAVSVFVKDGILFYDTSTDKCSDHASWVGCKASLVFFQYCVMANFYWLLVEGLYLHILLMIMFSSNRHFTAYLLTGWEDTYMEWKVRQTSKEIEKCSKEIRKVKVENSTRLTRKFSSNKSIARGRQKKGEITLSSGGKILIEDQKYNPYKGSQLLFGFCIQKKWSFE